MTLPIDKLSADEREAWEERAAIMEHDGGMSREHAELFAYFDVVEMRAERKA